MRDFRWYRESEPGLIVRKQPAEAITAESMAGLDQAMVGHFGRLWARPELAGLKAQRYGTVVSVGGGHPNLEASLNAARIVVADPMFREYAMHRAAFVAAWPKAPPVQWEWGPFPCCVSDADLVVFCHVLEHMELPEAEAWLRAVPGSADLLIYGPNSDRMAADDWLHARPVHEHLWLPGLDWMRSWAERPTGRTAAVAIAHDDDLLLWLPSTADASGGRGDLSPADPPGTGALADVPEYGHIASAPVGQASTPPEAV